MSGVTFQALTMGGGPSSVSFRTTSTQDTALTTYTFSTQDIGTAALGRRVIVGVVGSGAATRTISSVTIGGVTASQVNFVEGTSAGVFVQSALYALQVDTGTTANIVVTFSAGSNRCGIGVWAAYGISSTTASGQSTANPQTASLNISAGGIALGIANGFDNNTLTGYGWTNLTENFDGLFGTNQVCHTGASAFFPTAQTALALTATPQGAPSFDVGSACFASFR